MRFDDLSGDTLTHKSVGQPRKCSHDAKSLQDVDRIQLVGVAEPRESCNKQLNTILTLMTQ